jgi:hypothetical protein
MAVTGIPHIKMVVLSVHDITPQMPDEKNLSLPE